MRRFMSWRGNMLPCMSLCLRRECSLLRERWSRQMMNVSGTAVEKRKIKKN
ncbi:hypothetical protein AB205_0074580 [Aquarana catesbeiana]|uniref:Uncharacterized protein n=1 Tax=Aquarana catesbeiana TaxID=8400 RepID=A0A2G9R593_AQUCT|nr:hypothetical protein AB205_0074580 [Aquarana catesbeiana]